MAGSAVAVVGLLLAFVFPAACGFSLLHSTSSTRRPVLHASTEADVSVNGSSESLENIKRSVRQKGAHIPEPEHPIPQYLMKLPRHSHEGVNKILLQTEAAINGLHQDVEPKNTFRSLSDDDSGPLHGQVFANSYVDLGKVDTVGFDYDYTLVNYKEELLDLIYDMALKRLVNEKHYPLEMLEAGLQYNPRFSIRGLAVDKETGWICHLSYTHHVAVAWEGQEKVSTSRLYEEYRGKRALKPSERKKRLKPLNDLFSMAESCLVADTVQFFKDSGIPYCPRNAVTDVLDSITATHISGNFHRIVAENPEQYFRPTPYLKGVLQKLKDSGKRLIFVSNSPFWYVDAGMRYVIGENWINFWDAVIVSAGKPSFYTEDNRPFREISKETARATFKRVEKFEKGEVYTEGCLKELTRLMPNWAAKSGQNTFSVDTKGAGVSLDSPNVLYIGDSLFADLVDAKREFGWSTAAITPEVGYEMEMTRETHFINVRRTINLLLNALRLLQDELGPEQRTKEDLSILDALERLVSKWRDRETAILGNPWGSVFRARYQVRSATARSRVCHRVNCDRLLTCSRPRLLHSRPYLLIP
jgi:HAD superfamily 5'-nucleotidase-like hydrolase